MSKKQELGKWGESEAEEYLKQLGYRILERNHQIGKQEADLIALDGDILVFVEVKTRSTGHWGQPEDFVDEKKERHLVRLAQSYLEKNGLTNEIRFDIVSILREGQSTKLRHIPGII